MALKVPSRPTPPHHPVADAWHDNRACCHVALQVHRAFASVGVVLRSVHADSDHWSSPLPLPPHLPARLVHSRTQRFVCAGTSDKRSRLEFNAAECKVRASWGMPSSLPLAATCPPLLTSLGCHVSGSRRRGVQRDRRRHRLVRLRRRRRLRPRLTRGRGGSTREGAQWTGHSWGDVYARRGLTPYLTSPLRLPLPAAHWLTP